MRDDQLLPRPASGLVVLTPGGVQQGADEREGSATRPEGAEQPSRTPEQEQAWQEVLATNRARRASPEWKAEQERKEAQAAYSASVVFADMDWYYHNVLSWIAYRNPRLIEREFSGLRYNGRPELIERDPRSVLRLALQKGRIVALRKIGDVIERVQQDDWLVVMRTTLLANWPKNIIFNSDEVKALWKPVVTIEHETKALTRSKDVMIAPIDISQNLSEEERLQNILKISAALEPGLVRRRQKERQFPFRDEIMRRVGSILSPEEVETAWKAYPHGGKPGKRGRIPSS